MATDLLIQPVSSTPDTFITLAAIDRALLDFRRDADHAFLLNDRPGYLYYRDGEVVGYGYVGKEVGPIALLNHADFPAVLSAVRKTMLLAVGLEEFAMCVPLINRAAVTYLLARKYRFDDGFLFMCDEPFGKFESYIWGRIRRCSSRRSDRVRAPLVPLLRQCGHDGHVFTVHAATGEPALLRHRRPALHCIAAKPSCTSSEPF